MNSFYQAIGTSKQSVHQMLDRRMHTHEIEEWVIKLVFEVRADHPSMSCRSMYYKLRPPHMGRDKFELLCNQLGLVAEKRRSPFRTTDSRGVVRFPNLLEEVVLTDVDQAYSSDITYYEIRDRYYYLTFVIDCFSRRILGHSVSSSMVTEHTTLPALTMALRNRRKIPDGIIFHSDGGGQYYDKAFLQLTQEHRMRNSMCEMAYQNGKSERINGVIKNNYLKYWQITSLEELIKSVDRAVYLYNHDKPHKALQYATPLQFEKQRLLLKQQTVPTMTESLEANSDFWGVEPQKI